MTHRGWKPLKFVVLVVICKLDRCWCYFRNDSDILLDDHPQPVQRPFKAYHHTVTHLFRSTTFGALKALISMHNFSLLHEKSRSRRNLFWLQSSFPSPNSFVSFLHFFEGCLTGRLGGDTFPLYRIEMEHIPEIFGDKKFHWNEKYDKVRTPLFFFRAHAIVVTVA